MKKILLILSCSFLLGCPLQECYPVIKGFIFDDRNNPVEGALIKFNNEKLLSDKDGFFHIGSSDCKQKIEITKEGYKPFIMEISDKNEKNIIMVTNRSEYVTLPKPEFIGKDSSSYIVAKPVNLNSTRFEFGDTLKIFLSKSQTDVMR